MKRVSLIVLVIVLVSTSVTYAANSVKVTIPNYNVSVNYQAIDITHSQYPVIEYKNITYFPMTYDYLAGIGLQLNFTNEEGLVIDRIQGNGSLTQSFLGANNVLGSVHTASIAEYPIKVNGILVNNLEEEYPILVYQNITYFPMTWRFAVTEFGWSTGWTDIEGFSIYVDGAMADTKDIGKTASNLTTSSEVEPSSSGESAADVKILELDKKDEYVIIGNTGDVAIDISGWKLVSFKGAEDQFLYFETGTILTPGQKLIIVSGKSEDQVVGDIIMANKPIWNNSSYDPALLYDSNGILLQTFGK